MKQMTLLKLEIGLKVFEDVAKTIYVRAYIKADNVVIPADLTDAAKVVIVDKKIIV